MRIIVLLGLVAAFVACVIEMEQKVKIRPVDPAASAPKEEK